MRRPFEFFGFAKIGGDLGGFEVVLDDLHAIHFPSLRPSRSQLRTDLSTLSKAPACPTYSRYLRF